MSLPSARRNNGWRFNNEAGVWLHFSRSGGRTKTMNVTMFDNDYYTRMIVQALDGEREASPDARLQAVAVMSAGAFIAESVVTLARAVTPCVPGSADETGRYVESLTESVMGISAGLCRVADSLERLAEVADPIEIAPALDRIADAMAEINL
jgi:hypothetical protein